MSFLSRLFSTKKVAPVVTAGPEVRDIPQSAARDILIEINNGPTKSDERIAYTIAMWPASKKWTQAEKAFYYYIIGDAIGKRSGGKDRRRLPFFAASVLNNPIKTNLAWYELRKIPEIQELDVSAKTAIMLYQKYSLPSSFDDLLQPWISEDQDSKSSSNIFDSWDENDKSRFFIHQGDLLSSIFGNGFITKEQYQQLLTDLHRKLYGNGILKPSL